jgi:hypothetical protein
MTWSRISRRQLPTQRWAVPLPRCLNTRALRSEARRLQEGNHIGIEIRVVVEDGINDTDQPRETLHAVVAPPTRQSDDE